MKKVVVIIGIGVLLSLGLFSGAFCATGGGHGGSGYSGGGYHGGSYSGSGYRGGAMPRAYRAAVITGSEAVTTGIADIMAAGVAATYPTMAGTAASVRGGILTATPMLPTLTPILYPSYPPAVTEPPLNAEPQEDSYWYFCEEKQAYYPYVASCPGGWTRVVPTPPQPGKEGR